MQLSALTAQPSRVAVATTLKDGAVVRQRPVCVYPKQARYNGSGDINVAANFSCVSPGVEQPGASTADLSQIRNSLRQRALRGPVRRWVSSTRPPFGAGAPVTQSRY